MEEELSKDWNDCTIKDESHNKKGTPHKKVKTNQQK